MLKLRPWLNQLTIKTTSNDFRKLDLDYVDPDPTIGDWGWAQRPYIAEIERQYNAGYPVRIITLKARQLGISTATEAAIFLWCFFHRGANGLVLSYEDGQAQELFQMTKTYWEKWPFRNLYTLQYSTKRQLRWLETTSQIRVSTAKNPSGARGSTIHALHASEVAFWEDPGSLWTGMKQTIPNRHGTFVSLESTANGMGNWFHEMWLLATEGTSEFVPMFFPWFIHPAYRMATTLSSKLELDADERRYLRMFLKPVQLSPHSTHAPLTESEAYSCIAWRRWAIINQASGDLLNFMQEYPATDDEAFIATGKPLFSPIKLRECFIPQRGLTGRLYRDTVGRVKFVEDPAGEFTIFKRPSRKPRSDRFFISGDPSETTAGDPACIQVMDRKNTEQVAVWHGQTTGAQFAREMMLVGDFYHHGMLCPEVEGGGQETMGYLLASGYDNLWRDKRPDRLREMNVFGWSTNYQRKQWCIAHLQRLIVDNSLLLHDRKTYNQLLLYVQRTDGTWGNSDPSVHDDSVMSLAINVTASDREGPYLPDPLPRDNIMADLYSQEHDNDLYGTA